MAVLVEVHDERRARAGAAPCGRRWSASTTATCAPSRCRSTPRWRCCRACPADRLLVTESGILGRRRRATHARGRRARLPGRRGVHARRRIPGVALAGLFGVKAGDLGAALRVAAAGVGGRAAGLDRGAPAAAVGAAASRRSRATGRSLRTIRCGRCAWSRPDEVKVVVIGQDPYPTARPCRRPGVLGRRRAGRARSRASSRCWPRRRRASSPPEPGALDAWARRGVLLLNPVLTVEVGRTGSHSDCGWQALTRRDRHAHLQRASRPPVFLLWGSEGAVRSGPSAKSPRLDAARPGDPSSVATTSTAASWPRAIISPPRPTSSTGGRSDRTP